MTMVAPVGAVGNAFCAFSKDLWARSSASTGPAASTGRRSRRGLRRRPVVGARSGRLAFEFNWRHVIERRMPAGGVVPAFDKVEDCRPALGRRAQGHAVEQLALESRKEALAQRVIVA